MKELAKANKESVSMLSKEFNNLEDKIITLQKNQVTFEKYLLKIIKLIEDQKELLNNVGN